MTYSPILPAAIAAGIRGSSPVWSRLAANHGELFEAFEPPLAYAGGSDGDPLVVADTADASLSTSFATVLRWLVPRNLDDVPIRVQVVWRATAAATLRVQTEGANAGTITVAGGSAWTYSSVGALPNGVAHGAAPYYEREITLAAKADTADPTKVEILSVVANYAAPTSPSGLQPSRWARADAASFGAAGSPIPSERVARLLRGPVALAQDRPVCVACQMQDTAAAARGGGRWSTLSSSWQTIGRLIIPPHNDTRWVLATYLSGDAELTISGAGVVSSLVDTAGWALTELDAPRQAAPTVLTLRLRSTGTRAALHTFQAFRMRAPS